MIDKNSLFQSLNGVLYWLGCVLLATMSFFLLTLMAAGPAEYSPNVDFISKAAFAGRSRVPVFYLSLAAISSLSWQARRSLQGNSVKKGSSSCRNFSDLIAEAFPRKGFAVRQHVGRASGGEIAFRTLDGLRR